MQNFTAQTSRKMRILCVEDDKDTCELIGILFPDYEVVFAHTVSEGVRLFETQNFNLCIFDNRLPDGSGVELCRQFVAMKPNVPIIITSGDGGDEIRKALDAGASKYMVKPYEIDDLQKSVEELIEKNL